MNVRDQEDIPPIPQVPPEIIEAISNERLVFFIGASASRIIGCSGWKELANKLVDVACKHNEINYHEKTRIIERYGPRKTITILKKILSSELYEQTLVESLEGDNEKKEKYPIYKKLFKLRGIYLTTNIDTHFDECFERPKRFFHSHQFRRGNAKSSSLFHLHGSLDNFSTVVFSTQEYVNHYNSKEIRDFLKFIFTEYAVLFVGYSLSELEILDYVLLKGNSIQEPPEEQKTGKHFILLPFFKAEKNLLRFEKEYFSGLNVSVIPYAIDEKGYEQLYDVVESWEKEINMRTSFLPRNYGYIEKNIDHYDEETAVEIFQLIRNDEYFRNHFFKKVKSVEWFYPLKERDFFSPEHAPAPITSDTEGHFRIPQWDVLPYLERVSQKVTVQGDERLIDELLTIIRDVSNFRDTNNKHIDNYRTWWYFVKILLNIPNERIPLEIIELIPIWLDSKFNMDLPGSKIAKKLLPKFLPETLSEEDIQKAEKIVDYITAIKGVDVPAGFDSHTSSERREPRTVVETFWLMESFVKQGNAAKIGEKCTEKPIYLIADKLKKIFTYLHPFHQCNVEFEDGDYRLTVSSTEDYEFYCLVEIHRKEQLRYERVSGFRIEECKNIESFIEGIKNEILNLNIAERIEGNLEEGLRRLYEKTFLDYSFIWVKSLSGIDEWDTYGAKSTLTLILREILLAKAKKDRSTAQNIFNEFLGDKYQYPLFKRLVLFVIGECWNDFKEEFWRIVNAPNGEQLFDDYNYEPEIYTILEKNVCEFTEEEKNRIKEIIEKGPEYVREDNRDLYIAYWKQKWYSALKDDPDFAALYRTYRDETQIKEEISFKEPSVKVGPGPTPLAKEEILLMSNEELAKFFSEFRTKDPWHGPTIEGLSDTLKEAAQDQPEKFISDFSPFLNCSYLYVYMILWGIKDAWKDRKRIDWGTLFDFINQYINRDKFWEDRLEIADDMFYTDDHRLIIDMTGELIQEGTKDDNWAFSEDYLPTAKEIIFFIIDNLRVEQVEEIQDPVTYVLNSTFGKVITALINLSCRIARLEDEKGEKEDIKWSDDIKNTYEKMLRDGIPEAYILFGLHMPPLYAIDRSWTEQKVKEFESIEEQLWSIFMSGYLFNRRLYHDLYKLMKKHYSKAIFYSFREESAEEGVIQHIALAYLNGIENISENSLFGEILENWSPSQIQELIRFFWMRRKTLTESDGNIPDPDESERLKSRIIEFWRWLYEKYKDEDIDSLSEDDKKILSNMTRLAVFLPKIDHENIDWLMLSAPYIQLDHSFLFFIEYLDNLKDEGEMVESGKFVGRILHRILDEFIPEYGDEYIRSIVEFLYETKEREVADMANEICNIYLSRGEELLRDIYEKYNSGEPN
jgi:hypothetical protein